MKKHPPYFENLHPPFIKGDASYGYIYRNKYLPLHFIFTPPILKILLLFPKGYFIMNVPPPHFIKFRKIRTPCLFHLLLKLSTKELNQFYQFNLLIMETLEKVSKKK